MMSRLELDRIQKELKVAVQDHQMLVAKMKAEPEHSELHQTLHNLQSEIRNLSELQKSTVHQLKNEIITLQTNNSHSNATTTTTPTTTTVSPQPATQCTTGVLSLSTCAIQSVCLPASSLSTPDTDSVDMVVDDEIKNISTHDQTGSVGVSFDSKSLLDCHVKLYDLNQQQQQQQQQQQCVKDSMDCCGDKEKMLFMAGLQLINPGSLKDLHSKRSDHKRRHNIHYQLSYGQLESEMEVHEDCCCLCRRSGELLMCDVCSLVYHLQCLEPPLTVVPTGLWSCPKCQSLGKLCGGKDDWPGTLALVHSYLTHKAAREEEKQKLRRQNQELTAERQTLQQRATQLADSMAQRLQRRNELLDSCTQAQQSFNNMRSFVLLFCPKSANVV